MRIRLVGLRGTNMFGAILPSRNSGFANMQNACVLRVVRVLRRLVYMTPVPYVYNITRLCRARTRFRSN